MKQITLDLNYSNDLMSLDIIEIKDALNELYLELKDDDRLKLEINIHHEADYAFHINQKDVDLSCHCQEDEADCRCSILDKLRKAVYQEAGIQASSCGCGGHCGCH